MKAQLVKLSALAAVFSVLSACTETTGTDTGTLPDLKHDPILFVHGYLGSTSNWDTMIGRFKADGWADYELYTYQFGVFDSNKVYLSLDLGAKYRSVNDLRVGHEILPLYPDRALPRLGGRARM